MARSEQNTGTSFTRGSPPGLLTRDRTRNRASGGRQDLLRVNRHLMGLLGQRFGQGVGLYPPLDNLWRNEWCAAQQISTGG